MSLEDNRLIWIKGKLLPAKNAKINILTPTAQYGINVFEGLRCYLSKRKDQLFAFRLDDHIARFFQSAKMMRLELNYDYESIVNAFTEVIKANNYHEDISVKLTLFLEGSGNWSSLGPTSMYLAPIPRPKKKNKESTLNAMISTWERINDRSISPRIKVGANYLNGRMAHLEASVNGYDVAIFLNNQGKVSESPGACIFIFRDNKLITPPLTASVLESITRQTLITLAEKELGIEVIERDIDRTELYIADEIFLCGTSIEIGPIVSVDKFQIQEGETGAVTKQLTDLYMSAVRGSLKKYINWISPIY